MSWRTIDATEVLEEFTPAERSALNGIQDAGSNLGGVLARVVAAARGAIRAGGYPLADGDTIPDQFRGEVIAIARWRWLISFPQLKALQTDARKAAAEDAQKRLDMAADQKFNVEPPTDTTPSGNWNSENKIVMRTHPIPRPGTQFQPPGSDYANPDGPDDQGPDA